jgi:hypothetical protein
MCLQVGKTSSVSSLNLFAPLAAIIECSSLRGSRLPKGFVEEVSLLPKGFVEEVFHRVSFLFSSSVL